MADAMYPYQIANWTVFLSVAAGVAATLTGLIFVAISINLSRILEYQGLSDRAAESILQLVAAIVIPVIALVPGQSLLWFGIQLTIGGVILWALQSRLLWGSLSITDRRQRPIISILLSQIAAILFVVAGVSIWTRSFGGLYWLVPAVIVSMAVGVSNAWVLLVEILR
jgi:hypothetical protein